MGFLTGAVTPERLFDPEKDMRAKLPRFTPAARHANWPLVNLLRAIGKRRNASAAQVALGWLLARKPWIVPIPGTTQLNHLDENLATVQFQLTAAEVKQIEDGFASMKIEGARAWQQLLDRHDDGANLGTSSAGGHGKTPLPRR
jgi:aryl-alcohol dehydrogenase-like predicted oxidoreductase